MIGRSKSDDKTDKNLGPPVRQTLEEVTVMLVCPICSNQIKAEERCYQIRVGNIEGDEETFLAEEDVAYYHEECFPTKT